MKKIALIAALALALPLGAVAQTSSSSNAAKPAYKPPTQGKRVTQKVVPKPIIKEIEEAKPVSDDPNVVLTPEDLTVAKSVLTGTIKCELGASVTVEADAKKEGFFNVTHGKTKYRMHPVNSRTGAVRLEDPRAEAMWLQLGNKSMLMSQKQGLRLADECQATQQEVFAEEMKKNPPKSLFEGADPPKK